MKGIQAQIKTMKSDNGEKISIGLRSKLDRYNNLLKEMLKNPVFKCLEDEERGTKIRTSINHEISGLKNQIESQIKTQMSDYDAFLWKYTKINHNVEPIYFQFLTPFATQHHLQKTDGIKNNLDYPILTHKIKDLITLTATLLSNNEFCMENYSHQMMEHLAYKISSGYKITSYHNYSHAFSVFLMIYQCKQSSTKLQQLFSPFEYFITYISALAHDINHKGLNSLWEIKNNTDIANKYNHESVLENMHIAQLYRLFRDCPQIDVLTKIKSSTQREKAKRLINKLILATDVTFHQKHLSQLKAISQKIQDQQALSPLDHEVLLENIFHGCDIGNPCLSFDNYFNWSILLTHQFNTQSILERENNLEVTPNFQFIDIKTHYRRQIGFIDFLAYPLWKQLCQIVPQIGYLEQKMLKNREILLQRAESEEFSKE